MDTDIQFAPATKEAAKARIALTGPSGSGKTYTALTLGCELAAAEGGIPAVIDTENGSASKYLGLNSWQWDRYNARSFSPESLTKILGIASGGGYPVVVIDSWSHYWNGTDGMLEQVDRKTAASRSGSSFSSGWKEMAPIERKMLEAILHYPGHLIVTLRVKTEFVPQKDENTGRTKFVAAGTKPQQRDQFEYEFDIVGDLDHDNVLTVSKTRIPALHGAIIPRPGPEFATTIAAWLAEGDDVRGPLDYRSDALQPDVTKASLKELYDNAVAAGLANAPVVDGQGHPTVLGELIMNRARALPAPRS